MFPVNCSVNIFRGLYMNDNLEVIIFFPYCKGFGFCLKKKKYFLQTAYQIQCIYGQPVRMKYTLYSLFFFSDTQYIVM